jgi:hypothetical protein
MSETTAPALPELGLYKHFKGHLYMVQGYDVDCNSQRPRVEYMALHPPYLKSSRFVDEFVDRLLAYQKPNPDTGKLEWYSVKPGENIQLQGPSEQFPYGVVMVRRFRKAHCEKDTNRNIGEQYFRSNEILD